MTEAETIKQKLDSVVDKIDALIQKMDEQEKVFKKLEKKS